MRFRNTLVLAVGLIGGFGFSQIPNLADRDTLHFVDGLRNPDGGYAPGARAGAPVKSSLRATLAAARALKYLGGAPKEPAATVAFVETCFDRATGGFSDSAGEPPTVMTSSVGAMAAIELGLPPERYRAGVIKYLESQTKTIEDIRIAAAAFEALKVRPAKADDWLRQVAATRNVDGTFGAGAGAARATGGMAVIVLRLGGVLDDRAAMLKAMRDGQRADGAFGSPDRPESDLESTYRVMRAFAMSNERPSDPAKLRSILARCRAVGGGYGIMPGQPPTAAGTYYAAIILHWLDAR
jgi:hypothetical protein